MKLSVWSLVVAIPALVGLSPLRAQNYKFQVVECGGYTVYPAAINSHGTIVGSAQTIGSPYALGFIYADGVCQPIGPGPDGISFTGIADNNDVIGLYGAAYQNFLYGSGILENLPDYPGVPTTNYCCLDTSTGVLAGNYRLEGSSAEYGFLYENGAFTPLPDAGEYNAPTITGVNKRGIVVGTMNSFNQSGFAYIDGQMHFFHYPGATTTTFNGINDNDTVVGTFVASNAFNRSDPIGTAHPAGLVFNLFTYDLDTDVWTDLNFPGPFSTVIPVGIASSGVIAAQYSPTGGLVIATPTN